MHWKNLKPIDLAAFNEMEAQLHHAAQCIAMAGHSYMPHQEDDSHTNMAWEAGTGRLVGRVLPEVAIQVQVAVHVTEWSLQLAEENGDLIAEAPLAGRNLEELHQWLAVQLGHLGFDEDDLQPIQHYQLPQHPLQEGSTFIQPGFDLLRSWADQRTNSAQLLRAFSAGFEGQRTIRIWPHHFDTGLTIPLGSEPELDTKGLAAGWAMADGLANQPYLYLYGWDESEPLDYQALPELDAGIWSRQGSWQGAYLTLEAILESRDQEEQCRKMLKQATRILLENLGLIS